MARDVTGRRRPGMFNTITTDCGVTLTPISGRGNYATYRRSDNGEEVQLASGTKREAEIVACQPRDMIALFR